MGGAEKSRPDPHVNHHHVDHVGQAPCEIAPHEGNPDEDHRRGDHTGLKGEDLRQQCGEHRSSRHILERGNHHLDEKLRHRPEYPSSGAEHAPHHLRHGTHIHTTEISRRHNPHHNTRSTPGGVIPPRGKPTSIGVLSHSHRGGSPYGKPRQHGRHKHRGKIPPRQKIGHGSLGLPLLLHFQGLERNCEKKKDVRYENT